MPLNPLDSLILRRRTFVTGALGLGVATALPRTGFVESRPRASSAELRGTDFALEVGATPVNYTGRSAVAATINGTLPAPTLRWREGDDVTLNVRNRLREPTSLHWHGILLPATMDGVPGLSFHGIAPGETFQYHFRVRQAGTYWYHAHSSLQEAKGVYGAIIIDPAEGEPYAADRDYVVMLSDWGDEDPHAILRKLKVQPDYYNRGQRTLGDVFADAQRDGWKATLAERTAWGRMRMNPTDLADVSALAYTYLVNGYTPADNWTGLFRRGERVRLRFINGSAMTYFDVRIPGLKMTVIAADGQPVHPVSVDEFRIGVAETLDVLVTLDEEQPYTIFAQTMDRSGYARATLSPRPGLQAPVPALDPRPLLTMADMGHDHAAMSMPATSNTGEHGAHGADHAAMGHATAPTITHPASETGNPAVEMQTMAPSRRLDDPGIGLRGNGRRVLTYADLRSVFGDPDPREPSRSVELHLTGNMERYVWGFDGIPYEKAEPVRFNYGERVRVVLANDTMMEHPIHLHGMWSDIEDEDGAFHVRKHTVSVPPGHVRSFRVSADALGRWAFHCHMLLHMELGMFREVHVA